MLEFDDFIGSGENDFMLPDNRSAAYCGNPDFVLAALLAYLASVVYIGTGIGKDLLDSICQGESGSAWCIQLLIVVPFYDFNIKACIR